MGSVEGETGSCSETCVMCAVDGTEEVSIKVEEELDIKDENKEAIISPPIKTEHEVRLQGVMSWWQLMLLRLFIPIQNRNSEITCNYFCCMLYLRVPYIF